MPISLIEGCRNCIYGSSLFEGLSEEELEYLVKYSSGKQYHKGKVIFEKGENINKITFLKSGLLKIHTKTPDQREQIISFAKPNDCVGLLSVFSNQHYQYTVTAIEDSWLYFVELEAVRHIIRNNGEFGIRLLGKISNVADTIIHNTYQIYNKNLRGRIAFILLEFANEIYHNTKFDLPVSRKEIGQLIGMSTENVIRIFSEFRHDQIIAINGKTITLLNMPMLMTLEKNA